MKYIVSFLVVVSSFVALCQDTSFVKVYYAGSYAQVPDGKIWEFEKVFVSSGDGFNIKINNDTFKGDFIGGSKIQIPYYIAEMELLTSGSMVSYLLYIKQRNSNE
jgi:hypothetical protein